MDNTEPSLSRNSLEGVTTKTYHLDQMMKSVGQKSARSAEHSETGEDIVWTAWQHADVNFKSLMDNL